MATSDTLILPELKDTGFKFKTQRQTLTSEGNLGHIQDHDLQVQQTYKMFDL